MRDLSVYLHVPFCEAKCPYCDFYSVPTPEAAGIGPVEYFRLVERELALLVEAVDSLPSRPAVTLYTGGGTPSLIDPEEYARFHNALSKHFAFDPALEWTLEANPGTTPPQRLEQYAAAGINRTSLGVQSFNDAKLARLGRRHTSADSRAVLDSLRSKSGPPLTWAIDLIFGAPGESLADWRADLEETIAWQPPHVSVYGLTIHEKTPFAEWAREGRLALPGEELEREMFLVAQGLLQENGLIHYEISNYARPGMESRHNVRYWTGEDYLGLGPAAHSFVAGVRWANPPDLPLYRDRLLAGRLPREIEPPPQGRSRTGELVMLGLRQLRGIDLAAFQDRHDVDLRKVYAREIEELAALSLLEIAAGRLRLTQDGLLLADAVMAKFF